MILQFSLWEPEFFYCYSMSRYPVDLCPLKNGPHWSHLESRPYYVIFPSRQSQVKKYFLRIWIALFLFDFSFFISLSWKALQMWKENKRERKRWKRNKSCVAAFLPVQWNPLKGFHFSSSPWDHRTFKQSHALKEEHNYNSDSLVQ